MLAAGYTQAAIAATLILAYATVKLHMHRLYRKWDVHTAPQAVAVALEQGFISHPGVAP